MASSGFRRRLCKSSPRAVSWKFSEINCNGENGIIQVAFYSFDRTKITVSENSITRSYESSAYDEGNMYTYDYYVECSASITGGTSISVNAIHDCSYLHSVNKLMKFKLYLYYNPSVIIEYDNEDIAEFRISELNAAGFNVSTSGSFSTNIIGSTGDDASSSVGCSSSIKSSNTDFEISVGNSSGGYISSWYTDPYYQSYSVKYGITDLNGNLIYNSTDVQNSTNPSDTDGYGYNDILGHRGNVRIKGTINGASSVRFSERASY